ncbi:sulfatase [Halococcus sp. AFM35]|uniref:sulfatase n=1 Tax=Halococcus sp. AFM35 TaxID=3421653 RepID=UPI003EB915A5
MGQSRAEEYTPNIVILVLDTARARNFSCYGHDRQTTPTVDSIAEEGTKFEEVTSVSPWTLPSHASLFTGVPPTTHRTNSLDSSLPHSLETLSDYVSRHGYRTVGMANNPWFSSEFGLTRGFDEFHELFTLFGGDSYRSFVNVLTDQSRSVPDRLATLLSEQSAPSLIKNGMNAAYRQFDFRDDDGGKTAVSKSRSLIGVDQPYLLFVNFLEPHLPYEPPESHRREFIPEHVTDAEVEDINQNAREYNVRNVEMDDSDFDVLERLYDAEIKYTDERINEIVNALKQTGDWEDTVLFILGDHGENIGNHQLMSHNYSIHETLTKVPLVTHFPEHLGAVSGADLRTSTLDIPATITDILPDIDGAEFEEVQVGTSLLDSDDNRAIVTEYLNPVPPVEKMEKRCENPKFDVSVYDRRLRAIYADSYKFVRGSDETRALYDVVEDRDEAENVIDDNPEKASDLETRLNRWIERHKQQSFEESDGRIQGNVEEKLEDLGYL